MFWLSKAQLAILVWAGVGPLWTYRRGYDVAKREERTKKEADNTPGN